MTPAPNSASRPATADLPAPIVPTMPMMGFDRFSDSVQPRPTRPCRDVPVFHPLLGSIAIPKPPAPAKANRHADDPRGIAGQRLRSVGHNCAAMEGVRRVSTIKPSGPRRPCQAPRTKIPQRTAATTEPDPGEGLPPSTPPPESQGPPVSSLVASMTVPEDASRRRN